MRIEKIMSAIEKMRMEFGVCTYFITDKNAKDCSGFAVIYRPTDRTERIHGMDFCLREVPESLPIMSTLPDGFAHVRFSHFDDRAVRDMIHAARLLAN